ncbi:hypothetical protein JW979_11890 [bacterium]|nr:hypothetical protein [candidate division CSSED10-310 bacterium]
MERIIGQLQGNPHISDWRLLNVVSTSYQLYVIGNVLDNIRKVITNKFFVTIYCDHNGLRGSTNVTLFDYELDDIRKRLDNAVFIATRAGNPMYRLPEATYFPFVETFDPTLLGSAEEILFLHLADRLIDIVAKEKDVALSSSEFFLEIKDISLRNSRGVTLDTKRSEIFFDGVLLAGEGDRQVEIHFEPRARRLQDLPMEIIVPQYARYARDSLSACLPASGKHPVILSGNALSGVFIPLIHHTSARSQYHGTSQFMVNESMYGDAMPTGELLTMISNPYIPFGLRTLAADEDGVPAQRFELIRNGQFIKPWATQQYADYLDIRPTGHIGNIEIPIGPHSFRNLMERGERVLNVVEFSAMMPDPVSGNFAAEIKLGYEYHDGKIYPVRGGSLSGNLISGFNSAYFSTESQVSHYCISLESFGTYQGPKGILFESFQVSGQ